MSAMLVSFFLLSRALAPFPETTPETNQDDSFRRIEALVDLAWGRQSAVGDLLW